eukprot:tig00000692_g3254.t1
MNAIGACEQPLAAAPCVLSGEELHTAQWLRLKRLRYRDSAGVERLWETCERTTRSSDTDGVNVVPLIRDAQGGLSTVLVIQYRPPINALSIEFPAGLVDPAESVEAAGMRELREETGFRASRALFEGPTITNDPGLTNASCRLLLVEAEAEPGAPCLDDGEHIEVVVAPLAGLLEALHALQRSRGAAVEAIIYAFALGIHFARVAGLPPLPAPAPLFSLQPAP